MIDKRSRIGVLMGGMSVERGISLKTGHAVHGALLARGWDAVEIDVGRDLPARLAEEGVDVAWIALHGRFGEDGCVQGLLEVMGVPYTGSNVVASAIAMDKRLTKRVLRGVGDVTLASDRVLRRGEPVPADLRAPLVIKPAVSGSTVGIGIAHTDAELAPAIEEALRHDDVLVLEEFVAGQEITVAVLDGVALPVVAISPIDGFFDFEAKYTKGKTRYDVPAPIPDAVAEAAQRAAVAAYIAIGCRGLARADFLVRSDDVPVFLEINTLPGMTATSLSPMAARAVGLTFEDLVERILHGAGCMPLRAAERDALA